MSQKALETLFHSPLRVRLLSFLIQNQDIGATIDELKKKLKIKQAGALRKELQKLEHILLLKTKGSGVKKTYSINPTFYFYPELKNIFVKSPADLKEPLAQLVKKLGKGLKFLLASGFFLHEPKCKIDLLIVTGGVKEGKLKSAVEDLEAEVGRELNYAVFTSAEFAYRYNMSDRFLLEILEGPREIIVNRLTQLARA